MTKLVIQFIAVSVIAFFSGLYGFTFFGNKIWEDDNLILLKTETPTYAKLLVKNALNNIKYMDEGNNEEIYKYSCHTLTLFADHLRPDYFEKSPSMKDELIKLKEEAIETENRLRESGLCYE